MTRNVFPKGTRSGHLFDVVRREMDDIVSRLSDPDTWEDTSTAFSPRTDVVETEKHYAISIDLPGMKADDFSLEVHEGRLTIRGDRPRGEIEEGAKYHRVERHYGKFQRTFALGKDLNTEGVAAEYADGVLTVVVPKAEKDLPRKIDVKVG